MIAEVSEPLLHVENLRINTVPDRGTVGISFAVGSSEIVWITGPSGSGKTTVLKAVARLLSVTVDRMRLQGVDQEAIPSPQWRCSIQYVHQKAVMFQGTVRSNLLRAFTLSVRHTQRPDMKEAGRLLTRLLLPENILDRDAVVLSVGEAARVALVRALMVGPLVLLVDEPTASLDPDGRDATAQMMREWVSTGQRCILGVSHDERLRRLLPGQEIRIR
jgi:putative ABC transport system ATP-binding protein